MEKDTSPWPEKTCDTVSNHPLQEVPGNAEAVQVSLKRAMPPCVAGAGGFYHCPIKRTLTYKLLGAYWGHATGPSVVMTPFLLVQALLLSSAASAAYLGGASIYPCPGSTLAEDYVDISCQPASDPENENNSPSSPPLLALSLLSAWPRRATSCAGHSLPLFKQPPSRTHLGHATGPSVVMTPFLLVQVSYLPCARCVCSSDRMLIAVSCPTDTFYATRKLLYQSLSSFCVNAHLTLLLLALSGDVELNPGPDNATPTPVTLEFIASTLSRLEISQNTVLSELAIFVPLSSSIETRLVAYSPALKKLEKNSRSY
ncbi:hypothetical protein HPB48_026297 [Haemaphysalis longicornis]|uniref:Uncharacterized protein n=1 Tax=Haemaphysalis longicornis TaxID=44386 RepID=A0A9J6HBP2_HAELO|nr:hypothetical protein HPB48_026297 [Haemaphysalis longicornis]